MENVVPDHLKDAFERRLKERKEEAEKKPIKGLTEKMKANGPIKGL